MRIATRVCVAAMAVAALNLSASAAEVLNPAAPAPADEKGSAQAQVWFERALSLDIGAEGAPDAVQAFAAMRRAAELGHTQAQFNVAAMLDRALVRTAWTQHSRWQIGRTTELTSADENGRTLQGPAL